MRQNVTSEPSSDKTLSESLEQGLSLKHEEGQQQDQQQDQQSGPSKRQEILRAHETGDGSAVQAQHPPKAQQRPPTNSQASATSSFSPLAKMTVSEAVNTSPWRTLGHHLASRLVEIGVKQVYGVPGDYNLVLLDQLLQEKRLQYIGCCSELGAGYAADGSARALGVSALVVTFMVGGLSAINAVAGAYSESLPLIVISGGPNSNDLISNRVLHHTTGERGSFNQQLNAYKEVTCCQAVINSLDDAHEKIDYVISEALLRSKPGYIQIACNLAGVAHPSFSREPVPYAISYKQTNRESLRAAVQAAADALNKAVKPVIVCGPEVRYCKAQAALQALMDRSQYATAVQPSAKSLVDEEHECFIGTYWGAVSSPCACEVVESSDCYLFVGPIFNDYSSVGYSTLLRDEQMIKVEPFRVTVKGTLTFGCVGMVDFLAALAQELTPNRYSLEAYRTLYVPEGVPQEPDPSAPVKTKHLQRRIQAMLRPEHAVLVETGDAWFHGQKFKLPSGVDYQMQMQYGSIGWSVGALLGYTLAVQAKGKRPMALIGDGSLQMTAQEISVMARYGANPILFLLNNKGYTIEVLIHDNVYNRIANWDYCAFAKSICAADPSNASGIFTAKISSMVELDRAIGEAQSEENRGKLCFLEVLLESTDSSRDLLEWGARVAACNGRK